VLSDLVNARFCSSD